MNFEQWEGAKTLPVLITVTEELVNAYFAQTNSTPVNQQQIPPDFPIILDQFINVPWLHQQSFIHVEQTFRYENSILIGDTLQCTVSFISVEKRHKFLVLHQELIGKNDRNEIVFSAKSTLLKESK